MKAYYELKEEDIKIIKGLYNKCREINLGNISFTYFNVSKFNTDINFYLTQYKAYWELIVKHEQKSSSDPYPIYYVVTDIFKFRVEPSLNFVKNTGTLT